MSLRDYFAAAALTGLCAISEASGLITWENSAVAKLSYEVADAMLAARSASPAIEIRKSPIENCEDTSTHD